VKIQFIWVGKTKSAPIKSLTADYLERIQRYVSCEAREVRDFSGSRFQRPAEQIEAESSEIIRHLPKAGYIVALEEIGTQYSSVGFARWLETVQDSGVREIVFVIGGPEGLSRNISDRARMVLSLGKMTWTHEMCRALLLEQVYRALCIMRNVPYHKGDK